MKCTFDKTQECPFAKQMRKQFAAMGGKKSRRTINAEQQEKMQAGRKNKKEQE